LRLLETPYDPEDTKQNNARELWHIINQYCLESKYVLKISHFLNKSNEGDNGKYNKNLEKLKESLEEIPYSNYFLKYLSFIDYSKRVTKDWQRGDPIEKTPSHHLIHATYYRIIKLSCLRRHDKDLGKPRPAIFHAEHNIDGTSPNTIWSGNNIYNMIKPFGYKFLDILEADGMQFKLYELWNPLYVCQKADGQPKPIMINGVKTMPIHNELYTMLYMNYIKSL